MTNVVRKRRVRTLASCPSCGRPLALMPGSWLRLLVNHVLMRPKEYVCRFCGDQHSNSIPPFAMT